MICDNLVGAAAELSPLAEVEMTAANRASNIEAIAAIARSAVMAETRRPVCASRAREKTDSGKAMRNEL
jgi:hypothetical protein